MTGPADQGACGAHSGLAADLRDTALLLLERARTVVEPLREPDGRGGPGPDAGSDAAGGAGDAGPPAGAPDPAGPCRACPVCTVLAALRGERSALAEQLAEHAAGLVAALVAALGPDAAPRNGARAESPGHPADDHPGPRGTGDPAAAPPGEDRPIRTDGLRDNTFRGDGRRADAATPRRTGAGRSVQRIVVHRG